MIPSSSHSVKIQLIGGKFIWSNKAKHCWVMSTNFLFSKVCWQMPSNVLLLHLKQTFPPIIWIFTEGDGIKSRLAFKIFSTLLEIYNFVPRLNVNSINVSGMCSVTCSAILGATFTLALAFFCHFYRKYHMPEPD